MFQKSVYRNRIGTGALIVRAILSLHRACTFLQSGLFKPLSTDINECKKTKQNKKQNKTKQTNKQTFVPHRDFEPNFEDA